MPNLTIRDAKGERLFRVEGDSATIGRAPGNAVAIEENGASKEHCRIERAARGWKLVDLESKNGTRVNGRFRNKAYLEHGDVLKIGATEIRFGADGGARAAAGREEGAQERRPRARSSGSDRAIVIGVSILGAILLLWAASSVVKRTSAGGYNADVIEQADELVRAGRYDEAIAYLREHGDSSEPGYGSVSRRLNELVALAPSYQRVKDIPYAHQVLSRLANKIRAYNLGGDVQPAEILAMIERLKTEFAGSDQAELARKEFPDWWAGRVPAPDAGRSHGDTTEREWDAAVARAREYEKEWRYREARETFERFLSAREAILDASQVEHYRGEVQSQLERIDRMAESTWNMQRRAADEWIRKKDYDRAEAVYQAVADKFGIDEWVRRAQAEIVKIRAEKKNG